MLPLLPFVFALECALGGESSNIWERTKFSLREPYCEKVARAKRKLSDAIGTDDAAALAREAEVLWPEGVAARLILAEVALRRREFALVVTILESLLVVRGDLLRDPETRWLYARALHRVGRVDDARTTFRTLVASADAIPLPGANQALLEAAILLLESPALRVEADTILERLANTNSDIPAGIARSTRELIAEPLAVSESKKKPKLPMLRASPSMIEHAMQAGWLHQEASTALRAYALEPNDRKAAISLWRTVAEKGDSFWSKIARSRLDRGLLSLAGK